MRELAAAEIEAVSGGFLFAGLDWVGRIQTAYQLLSWSAQGYAAGVENGSLPHMYIP
ncbi:hypothetical protein [Mesorhizobium sp.]|uniref:hypothetical protein n=1 Tax=Mesorhizobium sp. TaxID=1871066 RepID=UPI0025BAE135|nr:hypothetical protein [Mesorhizobium sp.]